MIRIEVFAREDFGSVDPYCAEQDIDVPLAVYRALPLGYDFNDVIAMKSPENSYIFQFNSSPGTVSFLSNINNNDGLCAKISI